MTDYLLTLKSTSHLPARHQQSTLNRVLELFAVASLFILPYLMLFAARAL